MNAEVKKVWLEALRSGRYKQGMRRLRSVDKFCCLGVLCDLGKDRDRNWTVRQDGDWLYLGHDSLLPDQISTAANLSFDRLALLMRMNDSGMSFQQIADWIEENL